LTLSDQTRRLFAIALLVVALVAFIGGLAVAAFAVLAARTSDDAALDVEPRTLIEGPTFVEEGELVWLRGNRDLHRPVTLDDRVLYPTLEDPRVMVDCSIDACAGSLIGTVEDLDAGEPVPSGWPDGVGSRVRVVRVGETSAFVIGWMIGIASTSAAGFLCAVASGLSGAWLLARSRRTA
jgi:hypothetical protein